MDINKNDLRVSEMLDLSYKLWEKNSDSWSPMDPKYAKTFILYMIEEIGESIAIIKKKGEESIMNDSEVREHFIEESSDVIMYFMDVLNRFHISSQEFSNIYIKKFEKNMNRNYYIEYKKLK